MTIAEITPIAVAFIAAISAIAVASTPFVLPIVVARRRRERKAKEESRSLISDIHENTANTHTTLLREDVDTVMDEQQSMHTKIDEVLEMLVTAANKIDRFSGRLAAQNRSIRDQAKATKELAARVAAIEAAHKKGVTP